VDITIYYASGVIITYYGRAYAVNWAGFSGLRNRWDKWKRYL